MAFPKPEHTADPKNFFKTVRQSLPVLREDLGFTAFFGPEETRRLMRGYVAAEMEERWSVFYVDEWLLFERAWTGFWIFGLRLIVEARGSRVVEAWVNRDGTQYRGQNLDEDRDLLRMIILGVIHCPESGSMLDGPDPRTNRMEVLNRPELEMKRVHGPPVSVAKGWKARELSPTS
jgi:hypothetical protein